MPGKHVQRELIVFPTELALRRFQRDAALEQGWVDASCHTTLARLHKLCLPYANLKGRRLNGARHVLMRRQVMEVAVGHFVGEGGLEHLSRNALGHVLDRLVSELAAMPTEATRIIEWMMRHRRRHKFHQIGTLVSVWRASIAQEGYADQLDTNLAMLWLLNGPREKWPPLLRDCKGLVFRDVRWFDPFEEMCVIALHQKLKVSVLSALPPAHADTAGDRLDQRIRAEIMAKPWASWAENIGDALAVDSMDLVGLADSIRIGFSRSAGAYGEIEDLVRRICWTLQKTETPPWRVALVVPDIGKVQDIVPHVFSRFGVPYHFRRGRPVLSSPCVKAFFAWLAYPLQPDRDTLIDLVRNPAIQFVDREEMVEGLLQKPPRLRGDECRFMHANRPITGLEAMVLLEERIAGPEDHFNMEALRLLAGTLRDVGEHALPLDELVDLLEELLQNTTVRPRESHEHGVWILTPDDAVGLDFDIVLFAGLNEGEFPSVPQEDALLANHERHALRRHLEEQGRRLPAMALPETGVLLEMQSVRFLTAMGMARNQLVFSYQSVDQNGREKNAGEYFRQLWNLAGWSARDEIAPGPYDQWRMEALGGTSIFSDHWQAQCAISPEDRSPMPGESFLPIVPLPLCRAPDEALQAAVLEPDAIPAGGEKGSSTIEHLVAMLRVEAEREAYLETPVEERIPSRYCGYVDAMKKHVVEWFETKGELSPTALETLARNRYMFLLEQVLGLKEPLVPDDMPDPRQSGGLIHRILCEIYSTLAQGAVDMGAPRRWAIRSGKNWHICDCEEEGAVPLAVFDPACEEQYIAFAKEIAERWMRKPLGHPDVWAAEQRKTLQQVINMVRYDVQTCSKESRYPAFFEHAFGGDAAVDLGVVKLKGTIDRIDLIFDESDALSKVRILDYKGAGRALGKPEEYVAEIRCNLDCQLPVYALAAQQALFGEYNSPAVNAMTEAGYRFYDRDFKALGQKSDKSMLPLDTEGLIEGFLATLQRNIAQVKAGDFAVDPLIESYNDYASICRTTAVAMEDLD